MVGRRAAILIGLGLGLGAAVPAFGQRPATSVQQDFEAATALDQKGDNPTALAAWEALERRTAGNKRSHAIVLVRKSGTLFELGRRDEAVAAARAGLADLPANDTTLRGDRYNAYLSLGRIAERSIDYASAVQEYREAEKVADTPGDKIGALLLLIETATYVDPAVAEAALARADAVLASVKSAPAVRAELIRRKGLLLLN